MCAWRFLFRSALSAHEGLSASHTITICLLRYHETLSLDTYITPIWRHKLCYIVFLNRGNGIIRCSRKNRKKVVFIPNVNVQRIWTSILTCDYVVSVHFPIPFDIIIIGMTPISNMPTNIQSYINVLLYMTYSYRLIFAHNVVNWFRIELRRSQNNPNK